MSEITLLPIVSEKAVAQSDSLRTYGFLVPLGADKVSISRAVKKRFNVEPVAINTARIKGKPQATMVQRGKRRIKGSRNDFKKAYVKLAEGKSIPLFEEKK